MWVGKRSIIMFTWMVTLTAACGGFLFGYDWVVIGGAKPFYELYLNVTSPALSGWIVSSALIGCIIGAPISGYIAEAYGRKKILALAGFLFFISALGTAFSESVFVFVIFRILGGIGIGLAAAISPMYIAEITPAERRGKMVAINQLMIVVGILSAQVINIAIAEPVSSLEGTPEMISSWNVQTGWRYMFGMEIIPAILFFVLIFIVPESPRWLVKKNMEDKAKVVLRKFGSEKYASQTLHEIQESMYLESTISSAKYSVIRSSRFLNPLIISATLFIYSQWSGVVIIFNYAEEVFSSAGFGIDDTLKTIVATGMVNLIFTLLALALIDKLGRRKLILWGTGGIAVIHGLIAISYLFDWSGIFLVFLFLSAIAFFATCIGPVVWVLVSEMFPNDFREFGVGICTLVLWIAAFLATFLFPVINNQLGITGTFGLYGVLSVLTFLFSFCYVRETRGKSLEEIEKGMTKDPSGSKYSTNASSCSGDCLKVENSETG